MERTRKTDYLRSMSHEQKVEVAKVVLNTVPTKSNRESLAKTLKIEPQTVDIIWRAGYCSSRAFTQNYGEVGADNIKRIANEVGRDLELCHFVYKER